MGQQTRARWSCATWLSLLLCAGCVSPVRFGDAVETHGDAGDRVLGYDTDDDGRADYWHYRSTAGRTTAVAYAKDDGQPGERIELDKVDVADVPHIIIALDGVPFEIVQGLYNAGRFRLFHPPARCICCYPGMTDLALAELFHTLPCAAYQATYFDRSANKVRGGSANYVGASNSTWLHAVDYRCSFWWDAQAYLNPQAVFEHELAGMLDTFRRAQPGRVCAYSVATAGLGTRGGRGAIEEYLVTLDRLCAQVVHERRGLVKITLLADHGHNLVRGRRVSFREQLEACGYHRRKSLHGPRDVVTISYGLVTYAAFFTDDPAGVAACLVQHADVEFASYPHHDAIIVQDADGYATITRGAAGFAYDATRSDPLRLRPILATLEAGGHRAPSGEYDQDVLFAATVMHDYPDPLRRIWDAFYTLVDNPPDLIVNLHDGACHGSRLFDVMIGGVQSTHGSLNRINSTTFVMTMLGELPEALPTPAVLPSLEALGG